MEHHKRDRSSGQDLYVMDKGRPWGLLCVYFWQITNWKLFENGVIEQENKKDKHKTKEEICYDTFPIHPVQI